jgi:MFS family permease
MPIRRPRTALAGLLAANAVSQLGNVVAVVALPWFVLETTGMPVYARSEFGSAGALAAAVAAFGAGGLAGTVVFGVAARRIPRRPAFVVMWVLYPVLTCGLVLLPRLVPLLVLLFAIGLVFGAYDPLEVTIHQENIPAGLRPQVFAILLAAEMTAVPLAMLVYGAVLGALGLRAALILFAAGNLLLGAYAVVARPARVLDPPPEPVTATAR